MPYEHVFASSPNISAMAMFDFYQPAYYYIPQAAFPFEKKLIRQWLGCDGVSIDDMVYTILTETGHTVNQEDVWAIPPDDLEQPRTRQVFASFDANQRKTFGICPKSEEVSKIPDDLFDEDDDLALNPAEPDMCVFEADDYTLEEMDE